MPVKKIREVFAKKVNLWPWGHLGTVRIVNCNDGNWNMPLEISVFVKD